MQKDMLLLTEGAANHCFEPPSAPEMHVDPAMPGSERTVITLTDENGQVLEVLDAEKVKEALKTGTMRIHSLRAARTLHRLGSPSIAGIAMALAHAEEMPRRNLTVLLVDDGPSMKERAQQVMDQLAESFKKDKEVFRQFIIRDEQAMKPWDDLKVYEHTDKCSCGAEVRNRGQLCKKCQRARSRAHDFRKR